MNRTTLSISLALACASAVVAGCSTANVKDILTNLDKDCVRHYAGSLASGVPASGTVTFTIDCQPSGLPPKTAVAPIQP